VAGVELRIRRFAQANSEGPSPDRRKMVQAILYGDHSHRTANGVDIHIWKREGILIARFRWNGRQVGVTLGDQLDQAQVLLRDVMHQVETGTFLAPSDPRARARHRRKGPVRPLTIAEFIEEFLGDRQKRHGVSTAQDYRARLQHVLDFFQERDDIRKGYPLAQDINEDFLLEFKNWLGTRMVARNGRR
jgi:hypothetical protein